MADVDLCIIGGDATTFSAATRAQDLGWRTLIINADLSLGGTCVNVECVPSKHLLGDARHYYQPQHVGFEAIGPTVPPFAFRQAIAEKRDLIAALRQTSYQEVLDHLPLVSDLSAAIRPENYVVSRIDGDDKICKAIVIPSAWRKAPSDVEVDGQR